MKLPSIRTTFDRVGEVVLPHAGIYILAYLGKVIYVGIASESVGNRLLNHVYRAMHDGENLGKWLIKNADHTNIRLDIIEAPRGVDTRSWLKSYEAKLIRRFQPLFNVQCNVHAT